MSFLALEIDTWILEVKTRGNGVQVSLCEGNHLNVTHFVRLDREQSETLRQFLNEALAVTSHHQLQQEE